MNELSALTPTPFLKWVGGKRQLQSKILAKMTDLGLSEFNYFEPFLGGGAIFFALTPAKATLSDSNKGLINLYRTVVESVETLIVSLGEFEEHYNSLDTDGQKSLYLETRIAYNSEPREGIDQAVNFLVLNKAGFNGLYRENAKGSFNVPFGQRKKLSLMQAENLRAASIALSVADIKLTDYREALAGVKPGDVVYFDPPYVPLTATSAFTSYNADGFTETDQENLANTFADLSRNGVHVMLSNSSAGAVRDLYEGFRITEMEATRAVSASTRGRASVIELLVTNF